jgi:hypothetical protein
MAATRESMAAATGETMSTTASMAAAASVSTMLCEHGNGSAKRQQRAQNKCR